NDIHLAAHACFLAFSRGHGFLVDQLNRASLPVAANIAEKNGRFTKADRRSFFGIARGSLQECVPLLELARAKRNVERKALPADMSTERDRSDCYLGWANQWA